MHLIETLEKSLGRVAVKEYLPLQKGDVPGTYADLEEFYKITGFRPQISVEKGVPAFVEWYRKFYAV